MDEQLNEHRCVRFVSAEEKFQNISPSSWTPENVRSADSGSTERWPATSPRKSIFTERFSLKMNSTTSWSEAVGFPPAEKQKPSSGDTETRPRKPAEHNRLSRKPVSAGLSPGTGNRQLSIRTVEVGTGDSWLGYLQGLENADFTKVNIPKPHLPASAGHNEPVRDFSHGSSRSSSLPPIIRLGGIDWDFDATNPQPELHSFHQALSKTDGKHMQRASHGTIVTVQSSGSDSQTASSGSGDHSLGLVPDPSEPRLPHTPVSRPPSAMAMGAELDSRGRSLTPRLNRVDQSLPPSPYGRAVSSSSGRSTDGRLSTVDLLNIPYKQQLAQQLLIFDHAQLKNSVGDSASLLDTKSTLAMYRANVKKTSDQAIQYEFAVFMVNAAQAMDASNDCNEDTSTTPGSDKLGKASAKAELLQEARQILQRLSDRTYPYAQYYLADGYASGVFNRGKQDYDRAFPLFVSAGKHGHAEASYRAALCYEFGWGCRRDYAKAVQFYRQSASKAHPGAATRLGKACLSGEMGLCNKEQEGVRWLKRATDSADHLHNSAPFELGLLHVNGYADHVFKDEIYAAQLFTFAAELGHPEANLKMGEAYEYGLYSCPKDPALSIHFNNGAAQAGVPQAMMALCAWYMVGAEPVLEKDEMEAYEWAKRAAETGYGNAEYAVGYFKETGMGCRRDPLEANLWYVRAAERGDERAKQRLATLISADGGRTPTTPKSGKQQKKNKSMAGVAKADEKDCIVM